MTTTVIALHQIEPQLTPEHEDAFWSAYDALNAAQAAGDRVAEMAAHVAIIDVQLASGLLTRERLREMIAPHLLDVINRADEIPEGRELLQKIRDDALDAVNGEDYAERAAGALFILFVDGVQNPRRHAARAAKNREAREEFISARDTLVVTVENMWPCLESGYWALEDIEAHMREAIRALDRADGDNA